MRIEREQPRALRRENCLDRGETAVFEHDARVRAQALSHTGTSGHDRQVTVVQAGRLLVVLREACRDAGDAIAALGGLADLLERCAEDLRDGLCAVRFRGSRELVDGLLGAVDELLYAADVAVALGCDALALGDEPAEAPLLAHRSCV